MNWPWSRIRTINHGKPVDEVVIQYGDLYFGVFIDATSGEPTGDFNWSHSPTSFDCALREILVAKKQEEA